MWDIKDKICLITGGTSGIGKVTAETLADLGATVTIVGRNEEAGTRIIREIQEKTGNEMHRFMRTDFASLEKVRELANKFMNQFSRLDVLINNAGVAFPKKIITTDGLEATFAINHFAPFLLTNLLLDLIKQSVPARIINLTSGLHQKATINLDDINSNEKFNGMRVYGSSKLANVLFTYSLAEKLKPSGITANVVHPGFARTNLNRSFNILTRGMMKILPFVISPEKGAETPIYLVTSPEVEGITGKYFVRKKAVESSPLSYDKELQQELWELSAKITKI
ncbi:MAG: SDR family oxidoreductase [Candidatus Hodarchaeota archaeon]